MINENELYHHGRLGQRWGKHNGPPYPLNAEGKQSFFAQRKAEKAKKKAAKERAKRVKEKNKQVYKVQKKINKIVEKRVIEEADAAAHEAKRQKAIQTGTAKDILKFKGEISNDEYKRAWDRIEWEHKFTDLATPHVKTGREKVEGFFNAVDRGVKYAKSASRAWNTFADTMNSFTDSNFKTISFSDNNKKK